MEVRIRGATAKDAEGVAHVLNSVIAERQYSALSDPFSVEIEREFIASMDDRGAVFVAEVEGQIVGLQTIEPFATYSRALAHVGVVGTFVLADFRRRGIGRQLLESSLDFARLMGYEKLIAQVRASNEGAQVFYRELGFVSRGTLQRQVKIDGQYDDQVLMELFIPEEAEVPLEEVKVAEPVPQPAEVIEAVEEPVEAAVEVAEVEEPLREKEVVAIPRVPVVVRRAKQEDIKAIAGIINGVRKGKVPLSEEEVLKRLYEKGYWLSFSRRAAAVAGWQAENLVTCIDDFHIFPPKYREEVGRPLLQAVEAAASELECEAAILILDLTTSAEDVEFYRSCGYERQELEELDRIWREVAAEFLIGGKFLMVKELREDRVTRPL